MGTIRKAACMVAFLFLCGAAYVFLIFALFRFVSEPFVLAGAVPVITAGLLAFIFVGIHFMRKAWDRMAMMQEDDEDYDQYGA